ncbi:hypothetical protein [Streptomyces sp. NPDC059009]|uniref:hypothetical protein n=1 Tax=Streptomyces sp. NPDC059009 TaxID=3346694 RepID=UPI0036899469
MGIESDKLVFDYLSRVGDVAQQRQLPSGTRMRLVSELRGEIERRRSTAADTPAGVRRLLSSLGTPEELVDAAGEGGDGPRVPRETRVELPSQRAAGTDDAPLSERLRRKVPRPRTPRAPRTTRLDKPAPTQERRRDAPSPPHLAGMDELGDHGGVEPDWWRVDRRTSPFGLDDSLPGFTGGVEIPEILKPPPPQGEEEEAEEEEGEYEEEEYEEEAEGDEAQDEDDDGAVEAAPRRRILGGGRRSAPAREPRSGPAFVNPLLLIAAALLTVGAIVGNLIALGVGWVIAYTTRKLSRAEAKWAVLGMPGLVAAGGIAWLWGRTQGRWGEPIADGHMNDAIVETWPWVLRGAAVASALFLLWRSQRQRP